MNFAIRIAKCMRLFSLVSVLLLSLLFSTGAYAHESGIRTSSHKARPQAIGTVGNTWSPNWSGFVVGDGSWPGFRSVVGVWNTQCTNGQSDRVSQIQVSTWVGLGGFFNGEQLLQAGTIEVAPNKFRFFWEYFPGISIQYGGTPTSATIGCGVPVSAFVTIHSNSCPNGVEAGASARSNDPAYAPLAVDVCLDISKTGQYSAEWVDERPYQADFGGPSGYEQLAQYNRTDWSSMEALPYYWTDFAPPNTFYNQRIVMQSCADYTSGNRDESRALSSPAQSTPNNDGSFTDVWHNPGQVENC